MLLINMREENIIQELRKIKIHETKNYFDEKKRNLMSKKCKSICTMLNCIE